MKIIIHQGNKVHRPKNIKFRKHEINKMLRDYAIDILNDYNAIEPTKYFPVVIVQIELSKESLVLFAKSNDHLNIDMFGNCKNVSIFVKFSRGHIVSSWLEIWS